jgi:hypothetical protein
MATSIVPVPVRWHRSQLAGTDASDYASASVCWQRREAPLSTKALREKALMSRYRRLKIEDGAFFFTRALTGRGSDLLVRHIDRLRRACAELEKRRPFRLDK